MNYQKIIKEVKRQHKFLRSINIEIVDSWGTTAYKPEEKSIAIYTQALEDFFKTKRFIKRLGKNNFNKNVILTLLHEACHVKQELEYGKETLYLEQRTILDAENHDENWLEIEADKFALKEIKNWNLTKLK